MRWYDNFCLMLNKWHVLRQRSGSPIDEAELQGIVIFADTADLPSVALGLLQDVKMRETMEQRGLQYMVDEHTAASVSSGQSSALANLVEALTELSKSYLHSQC
jgi:hypothetical protein